MKSIELTQSQIQAKESGATMFIIPIDINELRFSEEKEEPELFF